MKTTNENIFNCVLSLGPACRPAYHIQKMGLRIFASPFDWLGFYSLDTVLHLFETRFEDFFVEIENKGPFTKWHLGVEDVKNKIFAGHHFKLDVPLDEMQAQFREMMLRRFERMDDYLKRASKVCFLCNRGESEKEFENFLTSFSKLYPNLDLTLYNIVDNFNSIGITYKTCRFKNKINFVECTFCDENKDGADPKQNTNFWHGNDDKWERVLKDFQIDKLETDLDRFIEENAK